MAETLTFQDVVNYITHHASQEDLDGIYYVAKQRTKSLQAARAAAIRVGNEVVLTKITPKMYDGLTGTVESIRGQRADIRLDEGSTTILRRSRSRVSVVIPTDATTYTVRGVPLSACLVR